MKKISVILLVLVLSLGMLFAAGEKEMGTTTTGKKQGGTLKVAVSSQLTSALYTGFVSPDDAVIMMGCYEGLMRENEEGVIEPFLLEKLESDPDNLTYTLTVKQGIKLHDGSDFNAESVAFSLGLYKEYGRKRASFMGSIESFEVTSPYEVVIHLKYWDSTIPRTLARDSGYQTSVQSLVNFGGDINAYVEYLKVNPIGTGPFRFDSMKRDTWYKFVRFDEYWQGKPNLDGVYVQVYEDSMTVAAALRTGELDAYYSTDYALSKDFENQGYYVSNGLPTSQPMLAFNSMNEKDPFHDVRVRKAVCHAIDCELINETIYWDYMEETNQFCASSSPYYNPNVVGYDYNIEKAKELLKEAGFPNGFKTTLNAKNEQVCIDCATALQGMLKEVGIDATLKIIEAGDYGTALCGWEEGLFLHATSLPTAIVNQAQSMFMHGLSGVVFGLTSIIKTDEMDASIRAAASSRTTEEESAHMWDFQKIIIDDECIYLPIGIGYYTMIVGNQIHDHNWGTIAYTIADWVNMWKD